LLDEPTSALDPQMRGEVHRVLRDVARGAPGEPSLTMMIVTHDFTLASEISDELWVLEHGTLTERGEAKALLARRSRGATSTASARGDE
jgi:ABC-type polar amino acid transport system ATPase subunit